MPSIALWLQTRIVNTITTLNLKTSAMSKHYVTMLITMNFEVNLITTIIESAQQPNTVHTITQDLRIVYAIKKFNANLLTMAGLNIA